MPRSREVDVEGMHGSRGSSLMAVEGLQIVAMISSAYGLSRFLVY